MVAASGRSLARPCASPSRAARSQPRSTTVRFRRTRARDCSRASACASAGPGTGRPIVLLKDAQTTGGYPKLAAVVSADLGRFAQLRPLSKVRFRAVTPEDAQLLRREFIGRLHALHLHVRSA